MKVEMAQQFRMNAAVSEQSLDAVGQSADDKVATADQGEDTVTRGLDKLKITADEGSTTEKPPDRSEEEIMMDKIGCVASIWRTEHRHLWPRQLLEKRPDDFSSLDSLSSLCTFRNTLDGEPQVVVPIAQYPSFIAGKALAVLLHPLDEFLMAAQSGWRHNYYFRTFVEGTEDGGGTLLSGHCWTDMVMRLSNIVQHKLPEAYYDDHERPGSFYASHAEKQIIAFAVYRYIKSPTPRAPRMTEMEILVNKEPCHDCERFVIATCNTYNLKIKICFDERCDSIDPHAVVEGKRGVICYNGEGKREVMRYPSEEKRALGPPVPVVFVD
jgi:hypothetical protein